MQGLLEQVLIQLNIMEKQMEADRKGLQTQTKKVADLEKKFKEAATTPVILFF